MLKAVAERDKGDYAASRTAFLKILSDYPDRHAVLYNLGILYLDHDFKRVEGQELCPDVSIDDMKQKSGRICSMVLRSSMWIRRWSINSSALAPGFDLPRAFPQERLKLDNEQEIEVEKQMRAANKAIRSETNERNIKRAAREEEEG